MKLWCLHRADVCSLQPLLTFDDLELNCLALFKCSIALGQNRALMHENIRPAFALDEAVALFRVEPLHCSLLTDLLFSSACMRGRVYVTARTHTDGRIIQSPVRAVSSSPITNVPSERGWQQTTLARAQ